MKRMFAVAACALAFARAASGAAQIEGEDARAIERAGCRVRIAQIDARGVATVVADCGWPIAPGAVLATLRDPEKLAQRLSSLGECKRLPDGRVVQVHSIGWPLDDRQVTLDWRERALPDGGTRVEFGRAARQEPLGEGRVAAAEDAGHWEIRSDGSGGTRLTYSSHYDAGGSLKPWVVRRFQKAGIAQSLEELRAAVAVSR